MSLISEKLGGGPPNPSRVQGTVRVTICMSATISLQAAFLPSRGCRKMPHYPLRALSDTANDVPVYRIIARIFVGAILLRWGYGSGNSRSLRACENRTSSCPATRSVFHRNGGMRRERLGKEILRIRGQSPAVLPG